MEGGTFSDPSQLIQSFNEIQNNLADGFGGQHISQTKQVIGNMLLTMGTPFFAERLGKHIGEDAVKAIKQYASGELGLKDALDMAKNKFENDILPQAKQALFEEAGKYVPGLDKIDLSKASFNDVKNFFQEQVTQKLKSALPPEIADNLPESFNQADIINSVRQLGTEQALSYAKKTLPPDVYSQLESNQDLIRDPSRIASFIDSNIQKAQSSVVNLAKQTQADVATRISQAKDALTAKAEETLAPIRDKISNLSTLRENAQQRFVDAKQDLLDKYNNIIDKRNDFIRKNPGTTDEDVEPFANKLAEIKQDAIDLKNNFTASDNDLVSQLDSAKELLQNNTEALYSKINDLKTGIFRKASSIADEVRNNTQQAINQTQEAGQQLLARGEQAGQQLIAQGQDTARAGLESLRAGEQMGRQAVEESEGVIARFKSWGTKAVRQVQQRFTREPARPSLLNPEEGRLGPRGMDVGYPMRQELMQRQQRIITTEQDPEAQRELLEDAGERESAPPAPEPTQAPAPESTQAPEPGELEGQAPAEPLTERAPTITQPNQAQSLSEDMPDELPIASVSETELGQTAEKGISSIAGKVAGTLDEIAPATEEIPVLDIIMDTAGLIGSILGGKALLGGHTPLPPAVSGGSYEPNL
jgi:hypothetical protein